MKFRKTKKPKRIRRLRQKGQPKRQRVFTLWLLAVYLVAITAVILFKFPFKGDEFFSVRAIELIPFYVKEIKSVPFFIINIVFNVLFFAPFGVFVCLLKPHWPFGKKLMPIFALSLFFEIVQFILGIGVSDITDLITNTTGGIVGIGAYLLAKGLFKERTHAVINAVASFMVLIMLILIGWSGKYMIR